MTTVYILIFLICLSLMVLIGYVLKSKRGQKVEIKAEVLRVLTICIKVWPEKKGECKKEQ